jgi:SAM-dependent methyltransferase
MLTVGKLLGLGHAWAGRPFRNRLRIWRDLGLDIYYRHDLDGAGRLFAPHFVDFVRARHPHGAGTIFEWCCGPGFIGFSLLAAGLCECLTLADINPRAIDCVRRSVKANGLGSRVRGYVSDNSDSLPDDERFDVVVANPPFYCNLNPLHPLYGQFKDDLRPNDPGWLAHERFYATIGRHLNPGATLYIMEVEPETSVYFTPGYSEPWDIRPRPPIDDFKKMITQGRLDLRRDRSVHQERRLHRSPRHLALPVARLRSPRMPVMIRRPARSETRRTRTHIKSRRRAIKSGAAAAGLTHWPFRSTFSILPTIDSRGGSKGSGRMAASPRVTNPDRVVATSRCTIN